MGVLRHAFLQLPNAPQRGRTPDRRPRTAALSPVAGFPCRRLLRPLRHAATTSTAARPVPAGRAAALPTFTPRASPPRRRPCLYAHARAPHAPPLPAGPFLSGPLSVRRQQKRLFGSLVCDRHPYAIAHPISTGSQGVDPPGASASTSWCSHISAQACGSGVGVECRPRRVFSRLRTGCHFLSPARWINLGRREDAHRPYQR